MILWWFVGAALAAFLLVVLRGAPYVPTHKASVEQALDMLDVPKGGTILDLGSGDGVVLKAVAQRGYRAIGYEINPFLCLISYIRCWRYRDRVSVRWRDFWLTKLSEDTDAVFVFLAGPYIHKLHQKLEREHSRSLEVVSYGFLIPGAGKPIKTEKAVHLYYY